jgi:hypothetical protein
MSVSFFFLRWYSLFLLLTLSALAVLNFIQFLRRISFVWAILGFLVYRLVYKYLKYIEWRFGLEQTIYICVTCGSTHNSSFTRCIASGLHFLRFKWFFLLWGVVYISSQHRLWKGHGYCVPIGSRGIGRRPRRRSVGWEAPSCRPLSPVLDKGKTDAGWSGRSTFSGFDKGKFDVLWSLRAGMNDDEVSEVVKHPFLRVERRTIEYYIVVDELELLRI